MIQVLLYCILQGVSFATFTIHMCIGVLLSFVVVFFLLRYIFRDPKSLKCEEPCDVQDLRREIAVWTRAAASMSSYSKDEELVKVSLRKKVQILLGKLNRRTQSVRGASERIHPQSKELKDEVISLYNCNDNFID